MRRRVLLITKAPDFDERGEVVLGQCEPFTSGWRLVLILPSRVSEVLLSGTYSDLHRIMEACAELEDPADIRKRVDQMRAIQDSSVTETVAVDLVRGESTKLPNILEPTQTGELPAVAEVKEEILGDGFLQVTTESQILTALVADPDRASEVAKLKQHLVILLERRPRAILLDLSRVANLTSRAANELSVFQTQCEEVRVFFGLCGLRQTVKKLFDTLGQRKTPSCYLSVQQAKIDLLTRR